MRKGMTRKLTHDSATNMHINVERLLNKGILRLSSNQPRSRSVKTTTVLVISPPRACSSLVAGVLSKLGVYMGELADETVFEDTSLAQHLEGGDDWAPIDRIIQSYNAKHKFWGYKRPSSLEYLDQGLLEHLANPHLVFVFRDVLATALRSHISVGDDVLATMQSALLAQQRMIDLVRTCPQPRLLLSAEKIRDYPTEFVQELIAFLGLRCSDEQVASAMGFISKEPESYLNASRTDRVYGHLDELTAGRIIGWVRQVSSEDPCQIVVSVNGKVRWTCVANKRREDVRIEGIHSTGRCGFSLRLKREERLRPDDHVEITTLEDPATVLCSTHLIDWYSDHASDE